MAQLYVEVEFDFEHFQFLIYLCCEKLGLFTAEEFLSEPSIGFPSSSKSKFRDLGQYFWLCETSGNSNPSLTSGLKNPKILKLVVFIHSLHLEIEEGSGTKIFTG